ncbi:MAG: leucine-rich repeat domain-containing protein [Clostridiales bacterium]|nr:leucine-rich repeat domain-containing protein [Clostridiales bacterium]
MRLLRKAAAAILPLMFVCALYAPTALALTPTEVSIPDAALNRALHNWLGIYDYAEPILNTQLANITGKLDLSGWDIVDITGLEHLEAVERLDLSRNKITSIPDAFCQMLARSSLKHLDLSDNELTRIPDAMAASRLHTLDLSLNGMYSVPAGVTGIESLRKLNMSGNKLTRLSSALASMPALTELNVEANRLTALPSAFKKLSIDTLYINYNFLDLTDAADNQKMIDAMPTDSVHYEDQLRPLTGLTVSHPDVGVAVFTWDASEDIDFGGGVVARVARTSVLLGDDYIGEAKAGETTFTREGLTPGKEYEFNLSWDYRISGTPYSDRYTKCYIECVTTPGESPDPTATPIPSPTPLPTDTPAPTATPAPETPAPTAPAVTAAPTGEPVPTALSDATSKPASGASAPQFPTTIILLLIAVVVLLLIAVGIVLTHLVGRR